MAQETHEPTTRRAPDSSTGSWTARPALAWAIRAALVVLPLLAGWLSVRLAIRLVPRPDTLERTIVWVAGTIALSMLVYQLGRRVLRRFSSLGVLYSLSLTFPDTAPSRLRAALRAGRVDDLQRRLSADSASALEPRMKAKRMADLVTMVSRREGVTRGHSDRVRGYAELIGAEMGLNDADMHRLRWSTLLHDVGMLDVPSHILQRRGPIDDAERAVIERHPRNAIGYLEPFADWLGPWRLAASEHHERWDGTGYPAGLAGTEISVAARIVAVADAYDAMTATRSYQKPLPPAAARQELVDNAGTQFDPDIVRAFLNAGIQKSRAGLGPLGALVELPAQLLSFAPGVTAGAAGAVAVAVVAATVVPPAVSSGVEIPPPAVERVVEEPAASTTTATAELVEAPSTTAPGRTTSTSTTTTSSPTTTSTTTTTAATPPPPPSTTAPPTTTAPSTTTTTAPPPTTTAPPSYPMVPLTTAPEYPSV